MVSRIVFSVPMCALIAFGTYTGGIDVIAPDGSGRRTVASMPGAEIQGPAWSPDGRTIAFAARKTPRED